MNNVSTSVNINTLSLTMDVIMLLMTTYEDWILIIISYTNKTSWAISAIAATFTPTST